MMWDGADDGTDGWDAYPARIRDPDRALTLNGIQASAFTDRVADRGGILDRPLIARGALTLLISQACWWGALWIGFWNTTNRA
ncbi:hypothetical protein ACW2Q0_05340 [Nocardia sp. R16R-3T]